MLIGLTGLSCAGKNFVARLLEERGLAVLDVDRLGHRATDQAREAIAARFGGDLLMPDGTVDRRLLGQRVAGNPDALRELEDIIHPIVHGMTRQWLDECPAEQRVINAALLHRCEPFEALDCIILVKAPLWLRLLRAKKRDKLPFRRIFSRFWAQRHFHAQYFAAKADIHIVRNRACCRLFKGLHNRALARRLDSILLREGMVQRAWNRKHCDT